jgi:hypothetical protein
MPLSAMIATPLRPNGSVARYIAWQCSSTGSMSLPSKRSRKTVPMMWTAASLPPSTP